MKIQFIFNKMQNKTLANLGIVKYKQALESIGYTVELAFRDIDKTFSTYQLSSDVVGNATSVRDEEIGILMENGYRLSIFMLGKASSTPPQSNPVQLALNKNGNTAIIIPEEWYGIDDNASNILCEYLLHETAHAGFFFAGKQDTVHLLSNKNLNPELYNFWIKKGFTAYYLHLLTELKSHLETPLQIPSKTLKIGSTGALVLELQQLLRVKGYFTYYMNTGYFGKVTRDSVMKFQKANNLVADGIVGPKTWEALKKKPSLANLKLTHETEEKAILFLEKARAKGYNLRITEGRRTKERQQELWNQGRTTEGKIVTWTLNSKHLEGTAFDIAFVGKDPFPKNFDWRKIGAIGKSVGLKWGGDWKTKDNLHFEL